MNRMRVLKCLVPVGVVAAVLILSQGRAKAVKGVDLKVTKFAIESGLFNVVFAKELCSCHFVDGLTIDECKERDNLPSAAHLLVRLDVDEASKSVSSEYISPVRLAAYAGVTPGGGASARVDPDHPEFGCVLTRAPGF